ncbi:ATP-binding cassette domain-containing protein [Arthrobacter sp. D3-16]
MPAPALSVKNLALTHAGRPLVHPLTFSVQAGECVALLGASGSGKSLTASAVTGTVPSGITASGEVSFAAGLAGKCPKGPGAAARAALIRQDPQTSLNPLVPVGKQLLIPLRRAGLSRMDARAKASRVLTQAGIEDPAAILSRYTGELSGGQLQRVCIALALASGSQVLVADEPTTALDAVTRLTVLAALHAWSAEGRGLLFITHDLAAAASLCTRALVMEGGRVVEEASMADLLRNPRHPYTRRLVHAASGAVLPQAVARTAVAA